MKTEKTITSANLYEVMVEVNEFLNSAERLKMHKQHRNQAKDGLNVAAALWVSTKRNDEVKIAEIIRNLSKAVFLIEKTGYIFK